MTDPSTEGVTLAKALSIKNRLAGRLSQTRSNIEKYNSVIVGKSGEIGAGTVDVRAEYARFLSIQEALVAVKSAIQKANVPIYPDVLRLAEKKALLKMLGELDTKQGIQPGDYSGIEHIYAAQIGKAEVVEMVRKIEGEVDRLQDRLNEFNATTRVEISKEVRDLAS